ncbi:MAG: hypothetical protein FJ118_14970 [Deltaproteobacteria bacterium]|nr:hypothetical protein [Deltaproteobacteria bacterium]
MKISLLVAALMCSMVASNTVLRPVPPPGTFIVAAKCDKARERLADLVERPDVNEAAKIKEIFGLDILISCDTTEGLIVCIQCIDKDGSLRELQLLQKRDSPRFELLGFGCRCRKTR